MPAAAANAAKTAHRIFTTPAVMVVAVRPPGTKRAPKISGPPWRAMTRSAHAFLRPPFAPLNTNGSIR
jgi:hypothetical protein